VAVLYFLRRNSTLFQIGDPHFSLGFIQFGDQQIQNRSRDYSKVNALEILLFTPLKEDVTRGGRPLLSILGGHTLGTTTCQHL